MTKLCVPLLFAWALSAQVPDNAAPPQPGEAQPIFRVTVVERTTSAVSYRHHNGWTKVDLHGTPLAPAATGHADVNSRQGYIEVKSQMHHLEPAAKFGPEYLTYVMWAITPEGRSKNLGEVVLDDGNSHLDVTTDLQAFALIVTAEPYFGVTQPSDVVGRNPLAEQVQKSVDRRDGLFRRAIRLEAECIDRLACSGRVRERSGVATDAIRASHPVEIEERPITGIAFGRGQSCSAAGSRGKTEQQPTRRSSTGHSRGTARQSESNPECVGSLGGVEAQQSGGHGRGSYRCRQIRRPDPAIDNIRAAYGDAESSDRFIARAQSVCEGLWAGLQFGRNRQGGRHHD